MEYRLTELILAQRNNITNTLPKKKAEDFIDGLYRLLFSLDTEPCQCSYEVEQKLKSQTVGIFRDYL